MASADSIRVRSTCPFDAPQDEFEVLTSKASLSPVDSQSDKALGELVEDADV